MSFREPLPEGVARRFTEVAMGARLCHHMVSQCGDPSAGSNFVMANEFYPWEKVSDRARHYVDAALEHLGMWADHIAPLKFHPEHEVNITMRPTYTLARAALESAAQCTWLLSTQDPRECIRRHLSLIRWDLAEHRKSEVGAEQKSAVRARDDRLVDRVSEVFTEAEIRPPQGFLWTIRAACEVDDLALKRVEPGEEYEPGHFRTRSLPDPELMVEVARAAHDMTMYATGKYILWSGADMEVLAANARRWLADNMTLKDDHDPEVLEALRGD
jgi:hypothetical protein